MTHANSRKSCRSHKTTPHFPDPTGYLTPLWLPWLTNKCQRWLFLLVRHAKTSPRSIRHFHDMRGNGWRGPGEPIVHCFKGSWRPINGSLIGSCDREKGNDHRDKIFGPRIHFFIVFFIFLQTFFCQGQFFLQIFFCYSIFSFFFREETNKFWCPEGGYNIVFVPKVELCCPAGEFLS